MGEVLRVLW